MNLISVCKNVIMRNNKNGWVNPEPPIRISHTATGKAIAHAHVVHIKDSVGNRVASLITTKDGTPLLKCGAKVALLTDYDVEIAE